MPNVIKILPERVVNKIAAGEVIQRPESVVKELIENSIDAGSNNITLVIKDSGKGLIQIIDDGNGMSSEDAEICFIRHSTSKISDEKDLETIHTLGFRGEALYSITAIAQVEIRTKTKNSELGTVLNLENSSITSKTKDNVEFGTSISVKNLFYNTPARRNFLKSDATELKHIYDTFIKFCISYPEIGFRLLNEEHTVYNFKASDLNERVKQVLKNQNINDLILFCEDLEFIKVKGFIGKPQFLKKNRGDQYLFLNRRSIINKSLSHAVFSAYESFAKVEGYPFFILFLNIDPGKIDVNVHPSKLEVKFYDERSIYSIVNSVVKKALGSTDLTPEYTFKEKEYKPAYPAKDNFEHNQNFQNKTGNKEFYPKKSGIFNFNKQEKFDLNEYAALFTQPESIIPTKQEFIQSETIKEFEHEEDIRGEKGIWQIGLKYIVTRVKSGIILIDQHVAHERILYEKALTAMNNKLPFSQQLLFPKTIELSPQDIQLIKEIMDELINLGFVLKIFSKNTILMEGIPADVRLGNEENILQDILNDLKTEKAPQAEIRDNLSKIYACKAAIKFGDYLNEQQMISLVDQLFATSMPFVCPHGRPVIVKITIDELDKRFGRK